MLLSDIATKYTIDYSADMLIFDFVFVSSTPGTYTATFPLASIAIVIFFPLHALDFNLAPITPSSVSSVSNKSLNDEPDAGAAGPVV